MTFRRCRNPHRTDGPTLEQIITTAMQKLKWSRKKVMSWVEKENPALKHARPRELVDRGQGELVLELLEKRERDRINEQKRKNND